MKKAGISDDDLEGMMESIKHNILTKGMKPGDSKIVEFPIPKGDIYPPKTE